MRYTIDTEKREILVHLPSDASTTLEQVRTHIDKFFAGNEVTSYAVLFRMEQCNQGRTSNALPIDIEYRIKGKN